jgi:hypothetical protein
MRLLMVLVLAATLFGSSFASGWIVGYRQGMFDGWKVGVPDMDDVEVPSITSP